MKTGFRTFGPYTYTDDEITGGKLDKTLMSLKDSGWEAFAMTTRGAGQGRTTYIVHCKGFVR